MKPGTEKMIATAAGQELLGFVLEHFIDISMALRGAQCEAPYANNQALHDALARTADEFSKRYDKALVESGIDR